MPWRSRARVEWQGGDILEEVELQVSVVNALPRIHATPPAPAMAPLSRVQRQA